MIDWLLKNVWKIKKPKPCDLCERPIKTDTPAKIKVRHADDKVFDMTICDDCTRELELTKRR